MHHPLMLAATGGRQSLFLWGPPHGDRSLWRGPFARAGWASGRPWALKNDEFASPLRTCLRRMSGSTKAGASFSSLPVASSSLAAPVTVPSWEELATLVGAKKTSGGEEVRLPHAKERLFGESGEPRVVLYRDNASWCPYCHRVWLQLEEKRIPYRVEKVNMRCYGPKPQWYTDMVPSGLLPAMKIDGQLMTESLDIMLALEAKFPDYNPLMPPAGTEDRKHLEGLLRLERKVFGGWLRWLTSRSSDSSQFEAVMDDVEAALGQRGGPYFMGKELSFMECVIAPFLERIACSVPYFKGLTVRGNKRWPRLSAWHDAMDSRPAYLAMKSDDFGIVHNLPPQVGPCGNLREGEQYRALIDGTTGSWNLPLGPETTAWGFDDGTGKGGAKEEAAISLVGNHEAVVGFALRSLASVAEAHRPAVDTTFRHVAYALMHGVDNAPPPTAALIAEKFAGADIGSVVTATAYLRDRVGVPRDMGYPAARQLRAHLQWAIDGLSTA